MFHSLQQNLCLELMFCICMSAFAAEIFGQSLKDDLYCSHRSDEMLAFSRFSFLHPAPTWKEFIHCVIFACCMLYPTRSLSEIVKPQSQVQSQMGRSLSVNPNLQKEIHPAKNFNLLVFLTPSNSVLNQTYGTTVSSSIKCKVVGCWSNLGLSQTCNRQGQALNYKDN